MLSHTYASQIFASQPDAYRLWGRMQRLIYIGKADSAVSIITIRPYTAPVQELFVVTLAEALNSMKRYALSVKALSLIVKANATPRVNYYLAEALIMQGKVDRAKSLLEQLMLEHPQSIFSSKARIYLLGLGK
jgi:hypothetical protein